MEPTLSQLRTLRELHRLGTMGAVAKSLGYTHGAISQQIAALEREVGYDLTAKNGRRVTLTDAGMVLVGYADTILRTVRDAASALEATHTQSTGPAHLGIFATTAAGLLSTAVSTAARRYPGLIIISHEVDVDDATAAVRRGDVDVAFGLDYADAPIPREEGIEHVLLRRERFELALPPARAEEVANKVAADGHLDLADTAEWGWILPPARTHYGLALRVACRRAGFEPRIVHEVTDTAASLTLAAHGLGVVPITPMMRDLVSALTLTTVQISQQITREVILARQTTSSRRASVDALVDVLSDTVRDFGRPENE